jgi:hypothetical protein
MNRPLTKKEWLEFLEKACDEFDWSASHQQREWIGLTEEEKAQFVVAYYPSNWDRKTAVALMNDYEKYLKEKNT